MEMHLKKQIGPFGKREGEAFRQKRGGGTYSPTAQAARPSRSTGDADRAHPAEAWVPIMAVQPAGVAAAIICEQNMVHRLARAGTKLNGAHPFVLGQIGGDHEIPIDVGA